MNRFRAGIGNIVKFKPILTIHSGQPGVTYVRTEGKTLQQVLQMAKELTPLETIALVHANASEDAQRLLRQNKGLFSPNCKPISVDVAPVLGAHISPGVVGFALIKRE